ncbi:GGDEF domain-containing protein [Prauserella muralis]|uniref:GGDEF domain-containing protein n=1 Tax=Prauserella muralis TaxID=588067 RepID=A0A2V4AEW4_9PSEU|nr:GGDEF domain-containing protein [Prauserella muralis]PXY16547.1 hypothetical protein BAY60_35695 [Prauserella muralis]
MSATLTVLTGAATAAAGTSAVGWFVTARTLRRRTGELEHDGLTGLWRREGFDKHAPAALAAGNAIALLDLDGFKQINDTHGHPAGDEVLRAVAERLVAELGDQALLARLGGDEFAVITTLELPTVHEQLQQLATALTAPVTVPGAGELAVGVSLGVARLRDLPAFADTTAGRREHWPRVLAEGLAAADAAMYAAKALRRDWQLFDRAVDPLRPAQRLCRTPRRRYRQHGPAALPTATPRGA